MTAGAVLALIKALGGGSGGGGGGGGVTPLIATLDPTTYTLDKTWTEINTAYNAGQPVFISYAFTDGENELIGTVSVVGSERGANGYVVYTTIDGDNADMITDSADGYPSLGG